jgi:hypothetical protein
MLAEHLDVCATLMAAPIFIFDLVPKNEIHPQDHDTKQIHYCNYVK